MWYVLGILYQVDEDVVTLAIGNNDTDASLLYFGCRGVFRMHATTSEGALLWLDILREVAARLYFRYQLCRRVACIIWAISPDNSSLSVNISPVMLTVSFSLTMGSTPFSSMTFMHCR